MRCSTRETIPGDQFGTTRPNWLSQDLYARGGGAVRQRGEMAEMVLHVAICGRLRELIRRSSEPCHATKPSRTRLVFYALWLGVTSSIRCLKWFGVAHIGRCDRRKFSGS